MQERDVEPRLRFGSIDVICFEKASTHAYRAILPGELR
jgi:hypothetical protein